MLVDINTFYNHDSNTHTILDGPFPPQLQQDEGWTNTQASGSRPFSSTGMWTSDINILYNHYSDAHTILDGAFFPHQRQDEGWDNTRASESPFPLTGTFVCGRESSP